MTARAHTARSDREQRIITQIRIDGRTSFDGFQLDVPQPKQVWKTLLGDQAHDALLDAAELLVRRTDLAVLRTVPSYRTWCEETERALRELRYL